MMVWCEYVEMCVCVAGPHCVIVCEATMKLCRLYNMYDDICMMICV